MMLNRHVNLLSLLVILIIGAVKESLCAVRVKRVVGGELAHNNQFPYQVSLRYYNIHVCGGALISQRHVLTAAHCLCELLEEPYSEINIVTGSNKIVGKNGEVHTIKKVTCHPGYAYGEDNSWLNDLAVIELTNNVIVKDSQSPIRLPLSETPANVKAVLSGWGRPNVHGLLSQDLLSISVTTLNNSDCQDYYNSRVLPSQICTFEGDGKGACKGDSGSPLVYDGELVGVFSWTKPCAMGSPDVYTRVHHYLDFIKEAMK